MKKWCYLTQMLVVGFIIGQVGYGAAPKVEFVKGTNKIDVMIGGKHVTSYVYGLDPARPPVARGIRLTKPILYPVNSPSGTDLTRGHPFKKVEGERTDHPHHMGMYFTLDIAEEKFWGNSRSELPIIKHIKIAKMAAGEGQGTLSTVIHWIARNGKPLLEESRTMVFRTFEGANQYAIDFIINLKAVDKEVVFEDNKEGMFAIRVAHWLNEGHTGRYLSSNGEETEKNVWGKRAKWMRLEGEKDGKKYGITILNHPQSVNYPTYWHARGYGCFSANPMGQYVFQRSKKVQNPQPLNYTLQKGESGLFKYRMLIYEGPRNREQMEKEFKAYAGKESVVAPGAAVRKLAGDFQFTEGPAVDAQGNVFFSDIPNNRILKWSTDDALSIWRENSGGANGLYFDKAGNLLACEGENRRITSINKEGKVTVLAERYAGKRLNKPNDLWIDPKGGVYFSDPIYGRVEQEQDGQHVYYITPDRKKVLRVIADYVRPNGLIGTPCGKKLYVTDRGDKKTYVYQVNADGTLSDKTLFAPVGSDGMTLDGEGNLYLTTEAIEVYDRTGQKIETIAVPETPANVCFGGKDRRTLYITARSSLYAVATRVKGAGDVCVGAAAMPAGYKLVYSQSFDGAAALNEFEFTNPDKWIFSSQGNGGGAIEFLGPGGYQPKVRSPLVIGLLSGRAVGDFVLEADLLQTGKEYGHRDMCLFLGFQDPSHFYYVHLATKADPHAHNIFLVNNAPRTAIAKKTTKGIDWGQNLWHKVRLERRIESGTIKVFYDDMSEPLMIAEDKTFGPGQIGFGTFDDSGRIDNVKIWSPEIKMESATHYKRKI